jgi:hypothetical protein
VLAVSFLVKQDFRGKVSDISSVLTQLPNDSLGSSAEGVGQLIIGQIGLGQSKVTERYMSCSIQQDVLGLQVTIPLVGPVGVSQNSPVDNVVLVQMLQSQDKLGNIEPRSVFAEPTLLLQMPEKFSSALVIGHKVQFFLRLEGEFQSDEERTLEGTL